MKPTRLLNYGKLFSILLTLVVIASCKDDDDKDNTDYIGTWARTESIVIDEFEFQARDIVDFTKNSVTNLGQIWNPETEEWLNLLAMGADIDVNGNDMDVSVTEIAISDVDEFGIPTGELIYFTEDDIEFEAVLAEVELESDFSARYSVSGNELTLSMDDNGDGDFNDEGETQIYYKE